MTQSDTNTKTLEAVAQEIGDRVINLEYTRGDQVHDAILDQCAPLWKTYGVVHNAVQQYILGATTSEQRDAIANDAMKLALRNP